MELNLHSLNTRGPFEKVMDGGREAVTVMQSCSGKGKVVVA
jgi:hypothetical protein